MKRALFLAALVGLVGCDDGSSTTGANGENGEAVPSTVVVVDATRGRQDTVSWYITPDLQNSGGPGEFYIHVEAIATYTGGPRTQCGLTQRIDVGAGWRDTLDFVFECPLAPQYLTVHTRDADSTDFRVTHEWVY